MRDSRRSRTAAIDHDSGERKHAIGAPCRLAEPPQSAHVGTHSAPETVGSLVLTPRCALHTRLQQRPGTGVAQKPQRAAPCVDVSVRAKETPSPHGITKQVTSLHPISAHRAAGMSLVGAFRFSAGSVAMPQPAHRRSGIRHSRHPNAQPHRLGLEQTGVHFPQFRGNIRHNARLIKHIALQ